MIVSVFVVISHSRLLVRGAVARRLDGLLGNLYVSVVRRSSLRSVDSFLCEGDLVGVVRDVSGSIDGSTSHGDVFLEMGSMRRCVNSSTGYGDVFLEVRAMSRCVDGGTGDTDIVSEDGGLNSRAVLAFNAVNGRVVGLVMAVNLNGRLGVARRSVLGAWSLGVLVRLVEDVYVGRSVAVFLVVLLAVDTGTAVTFFFTRDTDLFFTVALLSSRGQLSRGGDRRVLTFPSGFLGFGGKFDL
jgi:hypothetical protein